MSRLGTAERVRRVSFAFSRTLRRVARRVLGLPPDWYAVERLGQFQDPENTWQPMGRFAELFAKHHGRVAHKWVHYFEIYDRLFERFIDGVAMPDGSRRPLHFLEIGVAQGGSLNYGGRISVLMPSSSGSISIRTVPSWIAMTYRSGSGHSPTRNSFSRSSPRWGESTWCSTMGAT